MGPEGVLQFCEDCGVEPTDLIVLILAWKFNAKKMGEFSRPEFVEGFKSLGYLHTLLHSRGYREGGGVRGRRVI